MNKQEKIQALRELAAWMQRYNAQIEAEPVDSTVLIHFFRERGMICETNELDFLSYYSVNALIVELTHE